MSLSLDLHHIITGSYRNGLQLGDGLFQVYLWVAVEEMWKETRSGLEKRFILILVQFLEIFFLKFFEEEVSDYLS